MSTPAAPPIHGKVLRPAIIQLGVADADELKQTLKLYGILLGGTSNPLRINDMAVLGVVTEDGSTTTVIYWEVPGKSAELLAVYNDLIDHNACTGVQKPSKPGVDKLMKPGTEWCTLADADGNVFGLVINPPFPFM